jgi:2'-5' RNA ligase
MRQCNPQRTKQNKKVEQENIMRPPIRAFIAIELDARVKRELALFQDRLKTSEADVNWSNPDHTHLTLKFLGDIQPEIVDDIEEAMARTAVKFPAFHMGIGALGAFPCIEDPKIIWAGITKRANFLAEIATQLDKELTILGTCSANSRSEFGTCPQNRPFMPHITLGRNRTEKTSKPLAELLKNTHVPAGLSQKVERIALFRSELFPKGPVYHLLYSVELRGEA